MGFPGDIVAGIGEAKAKVALLEGLGRTLPNPAILLRPLASREAIQSSRLEGTHATPRELLLFEMEPREAKSGEKQVNDWREVFNYRLALDHAVNSDLPLSLRLIRDMHRDLLTGVRGNDRAPGEFRRIQVAIATNHRFVPPPADLVPDCLNRFEKHIHAPSSYDPFVDCYLMHYQFETIHPFMDGNGRVGRLLLAITIQKRCGLTKPWLYLSEYFEKHREEYFQRLFEVSTHARWAEWVEFCIKGTIEQAASAAERCDKLRSIREKYLLRLTDVGGNVRLNQIVENLFYSPYVQVTDVATQLKVTYPTAKADLDRMVKAKILKVLPNANRKTYFAPEVFDAAYADLN
jgi:Fic family protein